MSTAAARARTLTLPRSVRGETVAVVLFVGALMLFSLWMRTRALGASLWMDEGLSIGIASQPFLDIPGVLRQDGSPPLYYLLLHVWMAVLGNGPAETQGLSTAIAVLGIPAGLWAGWTLFGRRAGLICASLAATNYFLTAYAQETRMYSLMVVLSLVVTATFLHVFVFRNRRYLPAFVVFLAAILYTHSWGIFVTAGTLAALGLLLVAGPPEDRRALLRDGLIGYGAAFLLYVPWLPTLIFQAQHTGAPWVNPPRFGVAIQIVQSLLNGGTVTAALVLGAGAGIAAVIAARTGRGRRFGLEQFSPEGRAVLVAAALAVATLAIAWIFSQFAPAWTTRYLGVTLGPIFLIGALGFARAGRLGILALVIVLAIWSIPRNGPLESKSNAGDISFETRGMLDDGDLVVTLQPEQSPLINYHLADNVDGELVQASQLGEFATPGVMDWRDAMDSLRDATPQRNLTPLLDRLETGQHVLLVHPVTSPASNWEAPWTELVRRRAAQWGAAMAADERFTLDIAVPEVYRRANRIGVRGVLYTKTGS
jgi:hypothetical protein